MICKFYFNSYICTHKKGLVAQLNSALDYGSRGYWFESSRGHLRMKSSDESQGFFCMLFLVLSLLKELKKAYKKVFQSLIEKSFSLPLQSSFWNNEINPIEIIEVTKALLKIRISLIFFSKHKSCF